MIADCPQLEQLELVPLPPAVREHVSACSSCKMVLDVFDVAGSAGGDACLRFEPLLAARIDGSLNAAGGNLLDRHLASCSTCRALQSLLPTQDPVGDHAALPQVHETNYDIGLEIGRGGMGRVLAARDLRIGRPVAIKELRGNSPALAARFEREARVTARLQHPGIVPIYEIGRWPDSTPFYAMRMVDGRMLRVAIDRATTLPQRLALLPNMIAACEAVAFAHGQRVIHRDLTPSNILVGAYGETVVIDWGLAKDLSATHDTDTEADDPYRTTPEGNALTGVGTVVGTAAYMPPEQARADVVDERADVYALGAILYHLLAGRSPYPATAGALEAVKSGPPTPIEKVAPRAPRDLVSIVTKAMARDPRDRYPSARELADELRRFQTGRLVEAHVYTRFELMKRFIRRHRAPVTVVVAAAVLLAGSGVLSVRSILKSKSEAQATIRELVIEKGRVELLGGNPARAAAYLYDAYRGERTPEVRFLLDQAAASLDAESVTYDCGGDVRWVEFSPDGSELAAACHDRGIIWSMADGAKHPFGNANGFDWVTYSDDGTRLATSGDDGIARIWDRTGGAVSSLRHGTRAITFSTFAHDASRLLTTGFDGDARIWDTSTGALVREIQVSTVPVYGVIARNGNIAFTLNIDGEGKGWDVATGDLLGTAHHGPNALGGELSRDDSLAITCGLDGKVKVWAIPSGKLVYTLNGHTDAVWKCVFSRDSKLALTAGHDGSARVWDLADGRMITSVAHGAIVWSAQFDHDGRRFYTLGADGHVKVWDVRSGAQLSAFDTARGKYAAFSKTGALAIARGDGRVQIVADPSASRIGFTPPVGWRLRDVSPDGKVAVVEDDRDVIRPAIALYATHTGKQLGDLSLRPPFAMSKGNQLAALSGTGIAIVDLQTGAAIKELAIDCTPSAVHLAASNTRLAIVCADGGHVIDVPSAREIARIPMVTQLMLSDDGARAITLAHHGAPGIWTITTNARLPLPIVGHVMPLGFAMKGHRVALYSVVPETKPHVVMVFDADNGELLHAEEDTSVTPGFDPSGRWLTTIGSDRDVTVWDAVDGSQHGFSTDSSSVMVSMLDAQASPDGGLIAAIGDYGRSLVILNARSGVPLAHWAIAHNPPEVRPDGFSAAAAHAMWTPDGKGVIASSNDVAIWPASHSFAPGDVASIVRKRVPWKVENGNLSLVRHARVNGLVTRRGAPVVGAKIRVDIRTVLTGASALDYDTAKTHFDTGTAVSDDEGRFEIPNLIPGEYSVTVDGEEHVVFVSIDDHETHIELTH